MSLSYLRSVMVGESKAYGFTIAFWGSGIILVDSLGIPDLFGVMMYGFGAVAGFGLLALFAFQGEKGTEDEKTDLLVFSTVHYLAAMAPIAVSYLIAESIASNYAFFIAGMNVSILYNLLMVVEKKLATEGMMLEKKIEKTLGYSRSISTHSPP